MSRDTTIVAIATPLGIGGIGVIRLSGPLALSITQQLASKSQFPPRQMVHTHLTHPQTHRRIDDGLVVYFKSPHSFTGEDCTEFHLHGNPLVLQMLVQATLDLGAQLATPGEFTKRAFINGKLDLTQAEAIADIIHAENQTAHAVALNHLHGSLFTAITQIRQNLMTVLEHLEGSIDFPDEIDPYSRPDLIQTIAKAKSHLTQIIDIQDLGKLVYSGIKALIIGRPNVGKSSLLNALIGEEKAIVSAIAGTTRDIIEVKLNLGGHIFELIDTAGIRKSRDQIESKGIRKINLHLGKAHLIIWVLDRSAPFSNEDEAIFQKIKAKKNILLLLNKSDKKVKLILPPALLKKKWPHLDIATKSYEAILPLKNWLSSHVQQTLHPHDLDLICNVRQIDCLKKTAHSLAQFLTSAQAGFEDAILALDLKEAILRLGELTGAEVTEEVLDGVFARFCVGK